MAKYKQLLRLFTQFFHFGMFTFGGGWSIVAQMNKLYVEQEKRISSEELLDITSVGRSLPGTMVGNVAFLYGYHDSGIPGGFACTLGLALPPMLILTAVTYFYVAFRDSALVAAAMGGIRAAVVPIIISAAMALVKGAIKFPACVLMAAVSFVLYYILGLSCLWLVILGAVFGLAACEIRERRLSDADRAA